MPATAIGLTLNVLGAVFLYLSAPPDLAAGGANAAAEEHEETDLSDEYWLPDQHPEGIVDWLRSRNKTRFGFLLLAVGFALQLLGFLVPGARIVA